MNLATVLSLTATLEGAAALAGWAGGLAYAVCRPTPGAPAWRHAAATSAAAGLAVFAYFSALVALGQGAVLSGGADRAPTAAGLLTLAAGFGLGAGVPWGWFRHAEARSAPRNGIDGAEGAWPVARRTSAKLMLPFAILGLVVFAPRARGGGPGTAGSVLAAAVVMILLAALAATLVRQRGAILKPAAWSAAIGIPLVTALMALSGAPPAEAFVFSAASSLVWAPIFGLLTWSVTGMQEAGFRIGRDGRVTRSAWAPEMRAEATSGPRAETRRRPRTRRRHRRR